MLSGANVGLQLGDGVYPAGRERGVHGGEWQHHIMQCLFFRGSEEVVDGERLDVDRLRYRDGLPASCAGLVM